MALLQWLMRMAMTAVQQRAGSRPPGLVPPRPGGRLSAYGSIFLEVIVEEGSSFEVRPRELEPMRCTARASAECRSNALTASLRDFFFSRPQELQGRLTEAILECVLLAGSSVRRCARVDSRRAV